MTTVRLKAKEGAATGVVGLLGWLRKVHPEVYNRVRVMDPNTVFAVESDHATGSTLSGDDAVPGSAVASPAAGESSVSRLINTIAQAGAAILPLVQQQQILKAQLKRAQQGLPPLDVGSIVDPNQGLNIGLNPGTQKTVLLVAAGLGGAFLLSRLLASR